MGFNVKSLYKENNESSTTPKSSGFNVQSLRDRKYELKIGTKSFGVVSYGAYKAVENGTLDSYIPKNAEEKASLDSFKTYEQKQHKKQKKDEGKKKIDVADSDYTPAFGMTREEYNLRKASNESLPAFGSYEYFIEREKIVGAELDRILKSKKEPKNNHRYAGSSLYNNQPEFDKKYADLIATDYSNILNELQKYTKGLNLTESGSLDFEGGKKEASYFEEKYNKVYSYYNLSSKENPYSHRGYRTPEYVSKEREVVDERKLATEKKRSYEYAENNWENQYNDTWLGTGMAFARRGDINQRIANGSGLAAYKAKSSDMEATEVYQALQKNLEKRNVGAYTTDGIAEKAIATTAEYLPQFRDQMVAQYTGKLIGTLVGAAVGDATGTVGKMGGAIASSIQMFNMTAGATYVQLIQEYGLDPEEAHKLATNTAVASSAIEFGLEAALSGLGKGKAIIQKATGKTVKEAEKHLLKELTEAGFKQKTKDVVLEIGKRTGKALLSSAGEGVEEGLQAFVEKGAERVAKEGQDTNMSTLLIESLRFDKLSDKDWKDIWDQAYAGAFLGGVHGSVKVASDAIARKTIKTISDRMDKKSVGKAILADKSGNAVNFIVSEGLASGNDKTVKLARSVERTISDKAEVDTAQLGQLAQEISLQNSSVAQITDSQEIIDFDSVLAKAGVSNDVRVSIVSDLQSLQGEEGTNLQIPLKKAIQNIVSSVDAVENEMKKFNLSGNVYNLLEAHANFASSPDNVLTTDFIEKYADFYVDSLVEKGAVGYTSMGVTATELKQALVSGIVANNPGEKLSGNRIFEKLANNFNDLLNKGFSVSNAMRNQLYAESPMMKAQISDIKSGDWMSALSGKYQQATVNNQFEQNEGSGVLSPEDAQKYNIVVSNLKRKAEELGLLDNNFFIALQNVNLYNPSVSDRTLISHEFHRVFAGNTDPLVASWLNGLDNIIRDTTSTTLGENGMEKDNSATGTPENGKITVGMSDDVRAELLNKKSVNVVSVDAEKTKALDDIDFDALQKTLTRHAKPIIEKVAMDFGILNKTYFNPDIELDFEYSRGSLKESMNKQHTMYGDFVKMLSVFSDVIKNAVGVETHEDKYVGTTREDASLKQMYVLASALSDETGIIPVKLEVKEFNDKANKLYLSVVLTKKESRYPHGNLEQSPLNTATPASIISISDLVSIVNPSEGDFLKYFPDSMLDSEQIEGKNKALAKDAEKIEKLSENKKRSLATVENADAKIQDDNTKVGQLFEDFDGTVDNILTVSDETAKEFADKRVAVEVLKNTPGVILDNVEDARDLKVIINYNKLYLAVRKDGVFKGHYHNLGAEIVKKLPEFLENPDAIIQLANGRLNLFATVETERGNNGIVSVELNSTKDIGGKYEDYNVVVTMFSSDDNYAQNLISGDGVTEKYKREDLSQVNPQLYKWLAIINDKSSINNIISQDNNIVNSSVRSDTGNDSKFTKKNTVLSAVEKTIKPEIMSNTELMSMLKNKFGGDGMEGLVNEIISRYNTDKSMGDFESLFNDDGKEIYSILQNRRTDDVKYFTENKIDGDTDLQSDADSDIIKTSNYLLESEGNESESSKIISGRDHSDYENLGREVGKRSGEFGREVQQKPRETQSRAFQERRKQQVKDVTYEAVPVSEYTDEMKALEQENLVKYKVKTVYFTGEAVNGKGDTANGFYYDGTLYLQIDSHQSIVQIRDHEITHNAEITHPKAYNKFRKALRDKLSRSEYYTLYNQYREEYVDVLSDALKKIRAEHPNITLGQLQQYAEEYIDGEILANLNAGTTEYAARFADDIAEFRRSMEEQTATTETQASTDGKSTNTPAEYAESSDAGGEIPQPVFSLNHTKKQRKTVYNEYQTNAFLWSKATERNVGDLTVLNQNGKRFVLIEATEDGYIELKKGKYEEVYAEYERVHGEKDTGFYEDIDEIRTEQNPNLWNLQYAGNRGNDVGDVGQVGSEELSTNTAGSDEYLRKSDKRESAGLNQSMRKSENDSENIDADGANADVSEMMSVANDGFNDLDFDFAVRKVKMKVFPPYNESKSDANEQATRWAHKNEVQTGAQKLISYHSRWYVIEKFDSSDLRYQIIGAVSTKEVNRFINEVKKRESGFKQAKQRVLDGLDDSVEIGGSVGLRRYRVDHDANQHGRKFEQIQELDKNQNEQRSLSNNARGNIKQDGTNRQNRGGIDIREHVEVSENIGADGGIRFSLFPGGVFPPYNKSHSDTNERATRWAHNEKLESGAQRIFFYKGSPYLVEKFDSMDLKYLVVEKLNKKSLSRYDRNMVEYEKRDNNGRNNGLQSGRKRTVSDNRQNKGFRESGRGSHDDNNSSDQYNGKASEIQSLDREQDEKWSSRNDRNRDYKRDIEDSEGENVRFSVTGKQDYWKPDLPVAKLDALKRKIKYHATKGTQSITDTANWLFTNIGGTDVFAIYSIEDIDKPTLLYESQGKKAVLERNLLLELLEEQKNGESIDGKSSAIDTLFGGNWLQSGNSVAYSAGSLVRGSSNRDASILQRKSSAKGSRSFRNVIDNILEIQGTDRSNSGDSGRGRRGIETHNLRLSLQKKSYRANRAFTPGELTKSEWGEFYSSLGELKRGMWFPQTSDGDYIFETDDKLIFTDGNYIKPKINSVIVFEELNSDEIEFGKEIIWNVAETGKSFQECCEIAQAMLGKGIITATDPYSDRTYWEGGNNQGKGNYSLEVDNGNEPKIKYSFSTYDNDTEFWQEWLAKAKEYGVIPQGENPARDIDVPRKISKDRVVSRFARTMMEAGITPDENISDFEKAILSGKMTHEVITNKQAQNRARRQIEYLGFEEALQRWTVLSESGKVGKNELALGMELYNQCITNKDVRNAMKIAAELASEATRAGQTLQACRMLKLMTPDGQLYYLEKSIQKMNDEFREKIGEKYKDITLDEELMEEFLLEKDLEKRDGIYDKICQNIADQIPATLLDKWNSWRYLAMLGNPRTHIRNIVGNAVFIPALRIKNYVGVVLERASKIKTEERTKSFRKSKEAIAFATKDFETMNKVLQGENAKYAVTSDIEGKRTIFKTKWLEKLRLKNFDFLEKEDMWFLKKHYVDSLARLITVRELDVNELDSSKLDTIRAIAVKEAQRATYRDSNSLAEALNRIQKRAELSDNKVYRSTSVLVEGVMPYKKTPLNIAKQGVFYSPVGVLVGTYKTLKKLKNGNSYSATEIIDDFSKGLTGIGIMLLGMFLAKLGLLSGEADEDKKKREFDKMTGEQSYALKIGKSSYTIDWMTPSCLPLFIGLELHELTKDEFEFADITAAVSTLAEPLLELSVFSGVSGVIDSAKYSKTNSLFAIISEMVNSYFLQALPTIGGQLSRIMDSGKREYYYTDRNSDIPKGLQSFIGQASSKIPFASYLFAPSVDEWGREEKYGNIFERIFENTVSPGFYAEESYSYVDEELKDLYESTGENGVLPTTQDEYYKKDGEQFYMDAELYSEVKKYRGQRSFELVQDLIRSAKYKSMSDAEKVKAIKKCYETAGEETKERMFEKVKRNSKR